MFWFILVVLGFTISAIALYFGMKFVPEKEVWVIERFNTFQEVLPQGLNFIIPFIDRIKVLKTTKKKKDETGKIIGRSKKRKLAKIPFEKDINIDIDPVDMITKDNANISVDTIVFIRIEKASEPKLDLDFEKNKKIKKIESLESKHTEALDRLKKEYNEKVKKIEKNIEEEIHKENIEYENRIEKLNIEYQDELKEAEENYKKVIQQLDVDYQDSLQKLGATLKEVLNKEDLSQEERTKAREDYTKRLESLEKEYQAIRKDIQNKHKEMLKSIENKYKRSKEELENEHKHILEELNNSLEDKKNSLTSSYDDNVKKAEEIYNKEKANIEKFYSESEIRKRYLEELEKWKKEGKEYRNVYKAVYAVDDYEEGLEQTVLTSLRDVIGNQTLNDILDNKIYVNGKEKTIQEELKSRVEEVIQRWGIKFVKFDIQKLEPGEEVKKSMDRQAAAEREKEAKIQEAEAEKQAAIKRAEGIQRSANLEADAQLALAKASAESMKMIADGLKGQEMPAMYLLGDKYINALGKLSESNNSKFVVYPADIQSTIRGLTGNMFAGSTMGAMMGMGMEEATMQKQVPTEQNILTEDISQNNKEAQQEKPKTKQKPTDDTNLPTMG